MHTTQCNNNHTHNNNNDNNNNHHQNNTNNSFVFVTFNFAAFLLLCICSREECQPMHV